MEKVLLLNPPGNKVYVRDYYCSKVAKTNYCTHPLDFLFLSGILKFKYKIKILDAIVDKLNYKKCLSKILNEEFKAIIFLTGFVSFKEDFLLMQKIKKYKNITLIGSGDLLLLNPNYFLKKYNFLDAIILDFTTTGIINFLNKDYENSLGIAFKSNKKIYLKENSQKKYYSLPLPQHKLFLRKKYSFPFIKNYPYATVLTDFGCHFSCDFCLMKNLGFALRPVKEVIKELKYLKNWGIREIYFADQTFAANKDRTIYLLKSIIKNNFNFGWVCFSRADVLDERMLPLMKKAGCHTLIIGVETTNKKSLKNYHKNISLIKIKNVFKYCKKLGIQTVATFILGLPEETKKDMLKTIDFALNLNSDYVSFNTFVPRTYFNNLPLNKIKEWDQSGIKNVFSLDKKKEKEIKRLQFFAYLKFYFRFSYILVRIKEIKNLYWFINLVKNGLGFLKNSFYSS